MLPDELLLLFRRVGFGAHAEPEVGPVLGTGAEGAVPVDGVELAAEGLAVECGVEGGPAGHFFGEEGCFKI